MLRLRQAAPFTMSHPRGLWLAACLLASGLLAMPFDGLISEAFRLDRLPGDVRRILGLSEIFAHGFGVAVALMLIWALSPRGRSVIPRVAACALLPGLLVNLIKLSVGRYRPNAYEELEAAGSSWIGLFPAWNTDSTMEAGYAIQAFPSAHAATALGLAIGLAWLAPRGRVLFFGLACLAMMQRVESQAHWPSDVFWGAAIALAVASWLTKRNSFADRCFARIEHDPDLADRQPPSKRAA